MTKSPTVSVAEAGRRGIQARIAKSGKKEYSYQCRMAAAARMFYSHTENGREVWASMTERERQEWYHNNTPRRKRRRKAG